ncbi:MAG: transglutaminase N-terminal domain-containing protein, partial [Rubrivivax sp.]|nr:transglutaminase N-terminal domain-containing protein [Rubrivivax sp.]
MELEVVHETRYAYTAPVSLAHHLAHLQPLQDAHQQLLAFDMAIEPA